MLQFHKALHTHKVVVHPWHLPLLRLPGGTCREKERERERRREREKGRGHQSQIGHLRRKGRKAEKKKDGTEKDDRFEAVKCIRGSGRGKEMEQKRLSEESSLVIAKSIHTIVCE